MTTEDEIRRAAGRLNRLLCSLEAAMSELTKDSHVHDWADSDTVTVREIRDSFNRKMYGTINGTALNGAGELLEDISSHREPAYIPGRTYRDARGRYWQRTREENWMTFGGWTVSGYVPVEPLELMP